MINELASAINNQSGTINMIGRSSPNKSNDKKCVGKLVCIVAAVNLDGSTIIHRISAKRCIDAFLLRGYPTCLSRIHTHEGSFTNCSHRRMWKINCFQTVTNLKCIRPNGSDRVGNYDSSQFFTVFKGFVGCRRV
jgi:hypothetical protein